VGMRILGMSSSMRKPWAEVDDNRRIAVDSV